MTTVLVILACLGASNDCAYFIASEPCTISECMAMSQPVAAWASVHPAHGIKRILCTDVGRVPTLLGRNHA